MHIESWEEAIHKDNRAGLGGLTVKCPICGREFGCNKTYHVYPALVGRKRQYYCSYSCYKQRSNPKEKDEWEEMYHGKDGFKQKGIGVFADNVVCISGGEHPCSQQLARQRMRRITTLGS